MNKKIIISIATFVVLFLICAVVTICYNYNNGSTPNIVTDVIIDKNDWDLVVSVGSEDSCKFVEVCYQEKYGMEKTILCKVVFENLKNGEYKCVSADLGNLVLQKSNLNSFKTKIITKN
jgi:hypothetical protein